MDNRYYFSKQENNNIIISDGEFQHLAKVRRCKLGDNIVCFNGDGFDYKCEITQVLKDRALCKVLSKQLNPAFKDAETTVYLAMIKHDALTEAIDHLAELNVKHVKLFKSDYSVVTIDNKKLEKLNLTSIQASKQCERADVMDVSIIDKNQIKSDIPSNSHCFFAYENATEQIGNFSGNFSVIVGPEGGFSPNEVEHFSKFATRISLGKTILRAEVACTVAVASLKAVQK